MTVKKCSFSEATTSCYNLYRWPVLGHQGLRKDDHPRLPKVSHQPRPPLVSEKRGCSRLRDGDSEDINFCEKPVLEVSKAGGQVFILSGEKQDVKIFIDLENLSKFLFL